MPYHVDIPSDSPFTLYNIPFGVISTNDNDEPRCATALGDFAIDLAMYWKDRSYNDSEQDLYHLFNQPNLNAFAAIDSSIRSAVRAHMIRELAAGNVPIMCYIPLSEVTMHLPMKIGGYSDFFCSLEHCKNCSPLTGGVVTENFYYAPSVYNGRVSSVIPSPQSVRRPRGVTWDAKSGKAVYGESKKLDFELEMGYFVSKPVPFGETMNIEHAPEHVFGFVLLNDWSSRDIQAFEMKPLGPFHSKGFGTSISPWIVTMDALKPFACEAKHDHTEFEFEHQRLPDRSKGTFDIDLSVSLVRNKKSYEVVKSNIRWLYWTPYQQIAHHASAGCGLATGDLNGTGTISGEISGELGCLFEATQDGSQPIEFPDGTKLNYLQDNDEVVLNGWCNNGQIRLGFGECRGRLLEAIRM